MNPVKIAIISDLHIGLSAKTQDMCPRPRDKSSAAFKVYNKKSPVSQRQKFIEFIKSYKISADYLVIPGDITDTAHPMQAQLASEIISDFAKELQVRPSNIIYVPGNHDLDWQFFDAEDETGIKWDLRYSALKSKKFIFDEAQGKATLGGGLFSTPYFSTWPYENLFVLGYNSSNHDTPTEKTHRGLISSEHVLAMKQYLSSLALPKEMLKVFIIHHHLTNISLPIPNDPDYSLATNAQEMINLLQDFEFDFIIHGHRHHPHFEDSIKNIPILCSGSFSAEIETRWNGRIQNQFHLLEFDKKDDVSAKGFIKSWASTIDDWHPSDQFYCGIEHTIPFGGHISSQEAEDKLFPQLHSTLNSQNIVSWQKVLHIFPDYKYLPNKRVQEVLQKFANNEHAVFDQRPDNYLVYRE